MKLDRNIEGREGIGKYALIKLRALDTYISASPFHTYGPEIEAAFKTLTDAGALDWGNTEDSEFFLIRLKDRHAAAALSAYARSAEEFGISEWAEQVRELATKAAMHPGKKAPD